MPTMTAAFCTGKETIELREVDIPTTGRGEVLVRVRLCGICGSDLHFYHGAFPAMAATSPGHEFAGEIVEVGEGVSGWATEDRVVVEPIRSCRRCAYCLTGNYQICPQRALLGTFVPGALAEFVVVPDYALYRLPDELDFDLGALVEPLAVCVHGLHLVGLRTGERVVVLGSGTIGLMTIYAAKAMGASDVVATFRHEHQGQGALMAGASRVVKDGETGGLEKEGFDVVVETVGGSAPTIAQALGIVRPGGRVSVLGIFTQPAPINALGLVLKEVRVAGGITYCRPGQQSDFDVAIGALRAGPRTARAIITHQFPLNEAVTAFATAADKSTKSLKVQIEP